jgi:hypothetical protein
MSKGAHNVFALVINFFNEEWNPQHITIGLFEASETTRQTLARSYLVELLDQYDFKKKIIAYMKDEGANLNAMTTILNLWWIVKFLV